MSTQQQQQFSTSSDLQSGKQSSARLPGGHSSIPADTGSVIGAGFGAGSLKSDSSAALIGSTGNQSSGLSGMSATTQLKDLSGHGTIGSDITSGSSGGLSMEASTTGSVSSGGFGSGYGSGSSDFDSFPSQPQTTSSGSSGSAIGAGYGAGSISADSSADIAGGTINQSSGFGSTQLKDLSIHSGSNNTIGVGMSGDGHSLVPSDHGIPSSSGGAEKTSIWSGTGSSGFGDKSDLGLSSGVGNTGLGSSGAGSTTSGMSQSTSTSSTSDYRTGLSSDVSTGGLGTAGADLTGLGAGSFGTSGAGSPPGISSGVEIGGRDEDTTETQGSGWGSNAGRS